MELWQFPQEVDVERAIIPEGGGGAEVGGDVGSTLMGTFRKDGKMELAGRKGCS